MINIILYMLVSKKMSSSTDELIQKIDEINTKLTKIHEEQKAFKDLIIELLSDKIENILIQQLKIQKIAKKKELKLDTFQENILKYLKDKGEDIDSILETLNKDKIESLSDKLSDVSSKNVKNCFTWCYSHINEIREQTLNEPNVKEFVKKLYDDKESIAKHNKNIIELLKYEANEINAKFKDENYFKKYINEIKKKYSQLLEI